MTKRIVNKITKTMLLTAICFSVSWSTPPDPVNSTSPNNIWPAYMIGATRTSGNQAGWCLVFKNNIQSFKATNDKYYLAFEAIYESGTTFSDNGTYTFLVDLDNKGIVAAVYSAMASSSKFRIDYHYDNSFMNKSVLIVDVFKIEKN